MRAVSDFLDLAKPVYWALITLKTRVVLRWGVA